MDEYTTQPQKDEDRERLRRTVMLAALASQDTSFGDSSNIVIPPYLFFMDDEDDRRGE